MNKNKKIKEHIHNLLIEGYGCIDEVEQEPTCHCCCHEHEQDWRCKEVCNHCPDKEYFKPKTEEPELVSVACDFCGVTHTHIKTEGRECMCVEGDPYWCDIHGKGSPKQEWEEEFEELWNQSIRECLRYVKGVITESERNFRLNSLDSQARKLILSELESQRERILTRFAHKQPEETIDDIISELDKK